MSEQIINKNKIRIKPRRILFFLSLLFFLFLFFLRDFLDYNIPPIFYLAVSVLLFILFDKDEMMAFMVSLTAINTGFQYVYALGFGIILFVLKYRKEITINKKYLIIFALIFIWELLHFFIKPFNFYRYLQLMMPFILLTVIMVFCNSMELDNRLIVATFSYMVVGVMSLIFLSTLKDFDFSFNAILGKGFRLGFLIEETEEFVLSNNPNLLGLLCNMAICGFHLLFNKQESKKSVKLLYSLFIGALIIFGLLTASRAFIVVLAFIFLLSIVVASKGVPMKAVKTIGLYIAFILVVILAISLINPQIINNILLRFSVEDISSGRTELFSIYNKILFTNPKILFFGVGLQSTYDKVLVLTNQLIFNVSHNAIQDILIAWGIPGLILIICVFWGMFIETKRKHGNLYLINCIAIFALIFDVQVARLINSTAILMCWVFTYFCLTYSLEQNI